jgi:hypothetical protein
MLKNLRNGNRFKIPDGERSGGTVMIDFLLFVAVGCLSGMWQVGFSAA